ncbi:hypothetical protein [Pseudarthrobacter sp. GA104]|uniref:hypothetical protein n=1 Tax=Pseudarthrobacter sp. GA104 TaxID=2676311 RepID=UPI0012F7D524|nr:hypothetical protein [Pseudarthrobacter sp. GA104]MUU72049.1 hypothetical protein [Pseudarthrobacter sp. GA104]
MRIGETGRELVLTTEDDAPQIVFITALNSPSISDAADLALNGEGFASGEEAAEAAERWSSYLQLGLARRYAGAEFSRAEPEAGRFMFEHEGSPVLKDAPGKIIYKTEPRPVFSHFSATALVNKDPTSIAQAVRAAKEKRLSPTLNHRIAFDLFGMSFSYANVTTRFVTLMMAVETLINQKTHPPEVTQLIDGFLAQTAVSGIPVNLKASLSGALRQMKEQSVGQAGRELAAGALSGRTYQNLEPAAFFSKCYTLRSKLVHGESSRTNLDEVNLRAAHLELFVGDLLSAPLLNDVPDS